MRQRPPQKPDGLNVRPLAEKVSAHRCAHPCVSKRVQRTRFFANNTIKYLNACLIVLMISGCMAWSERYGKIRYLPSDGDEITIHALIENWGDYHIYYAGLGVRLPLGIMFDPKNNDTALVGDMWKNVDNQQTLMEIARWIYPNTQYDHKLSRIVGPDDRFYGYLYHWRSHCWQCFGEALSSRSLEEPQ